MQEVGDRVLVSGCVGKVFSSTSLEITFQDYLKDAPKKIAALIWIFSLRVGGGGFKADPQVLGHFFVPQQFCNFG